MYFLLLLMKYFLLFIILHLSFCTYSQKQAIIYKIHKQIGDTIDIDEKIRYRIFPQIPNHNFNYAQYMSINDTVILRVYTDDGKFYDTPSSLNDIVTMSGKINNRIIYLSSNFQQCDYTSKKVVVIYDARKDKKYKLKIGDRCYISQFSNDDVFNYERAKNKDFKNFWAYKHYKIIDIINTANPAVSIETTSGPWRKLILPLDDIKVISNYYGRYRFPNHLIEAVTLPYLLISIPFTYIIRLTTNDDYISWALKIVFKKRYRIDFSNESHMRVECRDKLLKSLFR